MGSRFRYWDVTDALHSILRAALQHSWRVIALADFQILGRSPRMFRNTSYEASLRNHARNWKDLTVSTPTMTCSRPWDQPAICRFLERLQDYLHTLLEPGDTQTKRGPLLNLTHTYFLLLPALRVLKNPLNPVEVRSWDFSVRSPGDKGHTRTPSQLAR